jgi:hypothetical protein
MIGENSVYRDEAPKTDEAASLSGKTARETDETASGVAEGGRTRMRRVRRKEEREEAHEAPARGRAVTPLRLEGHQM